MKRIIKWIGIGMVGIFLLLLAIGLFSGGGSFEEGRQGGRGEVVEEARDFQGDIDVVASSLGDDSLNIEKTNLKAMANTKGEGVFIYSPTTRFSGVERYIIWLVLEGVAYPLNGATKDITPDLLWPKEVDDNTWSKTGLDKYQATEAIEMVFGE